MCYSGVDLAGYAAPTRQHELHRDQESICLALKGLGYEMGIESVICPMCKPFGGQSEGFSFIVQRWVGRVGRRHGTQHPKMRSCAVCACWSNNDSLASIGRQCDPSTVERLLSFGLGGSICLRAMQGGQCKRFPE